MVRELGSERRETVRSLSVVGAGYLSSVSNKFLKGILIGYISEVSTDANKLTKSGTIIPAVDFNDIQEVLVIKELKQQKTDDVTSEESQTPDDSTTPTPDPAQDTQEDTKE